MKSSNPIARPGGIALLVLGLVLTVGMTALAPTVAAKEKGKPAAGDAERIVFPSSPAAPVIEWVAAFRTEGDVHPKKKKLKKILVGTTSDDLSFIAPTDVAVGPGETLYVVDQRLRSIVIVNAAERRFELFPGANPALLKQPIGVAVADDGTLFVSDASAQTVYVYSSDLRFLRALGGPSTFVRPTDVALSADGRRVAVCDTDGQMVYVLDVQSGEVLAEFGRGVASAAEGEFNKPVAVAFDAEGYLYVSDFLNFRIQVFDPDGDLDLVFGEPGDRPGRLGRPRSLAVDAAAGVLFELDSAFELVQMFNLDGELLMWFGGPGNGPAQFSLPAGIGRRGDLLAVADTLNSRVQVFRFLGTPDVK